MCVENRWISNCFIYQCSDFYLFILSKTNAGNRFTYLLSCAGRSLYWNMIVKDKMLCNVGTEYSRYLLPTFK